MEAPVAANLAARAFHAPWVRPFGSEAEFEAWWEAVEQGRRVALLVLADGAPAGVFNLNEIVRGGFQVRTWATTPIPGSAGRG